MHCRFPSGMNASIFFHNTCCRVGWWFVLGLSTGVLLCRIEGSLVGVT